MMLDFLADFDDGVSFTSDVAQRVERVRKRGGETGGSAGIADLAGLSLNATGKLTRENSQNETTENKFVREHTVASLFNRLRNRLEDAGNVIRLGRESLLDELDAGVLVEVSGTFDRNPLEALSQMYDDFRPYAITQQRTEVRDGLSEDSFETTEEYEEEVRERAEREYLKMDEMFETVANDLRKSQVVDLPLTVGDSLSALVVADRDYYTPDVEAAMLGGTFRVLGKVSGVERREGHELKIVRRGAIGFISRDRLQLLVNSMHNEDVELRIPPMAMPSPWLQIIPLAIYV